VNSCLKIYIKHPTGFNKHKLMIFTLSTRFQINEEERRG
jgi:hypothetical protein